MKEKLERVLALKNEIEKLLTLAVKQGASQEEIDKLLDDLNFANALIHKIQEKINKEGK